MDANENLSALSDLDLVAEMESAQALAGEVRGRADALYERSGLLRDELSRRLDLAGEDSALVAGGHVYILDRRMVPNVSLMRFRAIAPES